MKKEKQTLENINIKINSGKMTALVDIVGLENQTIKFNS